MEAKIQSGDNMHITYLECDGIHNDQSFLLKRPDEQTSDGIAPAKVHCVDRMRKLVTVKK